LGKTLDGFPWWSQITDPDPRTHKPDIYATTDCGEEVSSIWIAGKTGLYTDAADLRRGLPGNRTNGITNGDDIVTMLGSKGIQARINSWSLDIYQSRVRAEIDRGEPVGLLGYWIDPAVLHWVLGLGYGNGALLALDPWAGKLTAYGWSYVRSVATGDVVQAT
jgi:hypothetical protein